ncbi:hypothetical protein E2562_025705 [Oryza meyeriana var. granulata]|uniref:Uncharacterized protein n=1 Tax=Oryza meyeriana var. granulata TaxID=110450 RepID=A0A6G1CSL1_9ORYZ|nr:hypothetical protein E2562_025705 [Oryza meyeriana var. granulata]
MSEAGEKTYVVAEGVLPGVARGAVANKGGTVVTAVMPKQAKSEGKGAVSNGLEKAAGVPILPEQRLNTRVLLPLVLALDCRSLLRRRRSSTKNLKRIHAKELEQTKSSSAWAVLGEWPTWDCNR